MGLLDGKVAVVTGAGAGLGRCHALALAAEGATVVVNDLGTDRHGSGKPTRVADQVVAEIKENGGAAAGNYDSVATLEGAQNIVWTAFRKFGRLDILVNNAGILRDKTFLNMTTDQLDLVLDVHLRGTYFCMQAATRAMLAHGIQGRVINTTSLSGLLGNFGQANYAAAKAGIYGMTRVAHLELYEFQKDPAKRINVNALAPVAYTRMTEDLPMMADQEKKLAPERVSPAVVFLASDEAADISGRVIGAEGGRFFEYKMVMNDGWTKDGVATPAELKEHLGAILQE